LSFVENENGRNLIPEKLNKSNKEKLFNICDEALIEVINVMRPSHVIGIGNFAHKRAQKIKSKMQTLKIKHKRKMYKSFVIGKILHPSPASGVSHNFQVDATKQLKQIGVRW